MSNASACTYEYGGETEDYMVTIDTTVNVKELTSNTNFYLSPNPASKEVLLSSTSAMRHIKVLSLRGEVLQEQNNMNLLYTKLNVENLSDGIYFVVVETVKGVIAKKFNKVGQ